MYRRAREKRAAEVLLLRNGTSDSGPDMSFDTLASSEYMSGLNNASLAKVVGHVSPSEDMPEGVLVLSGFSRVWKSLTRDPILRDSSGNVMGIHNFCVFLNGLDRRSRTASNAAIPNPTPEDLAAATPNSKVLAKAEYSKRRMAYTSRASDDEESEDDDDDACYEIPIITPIRSVATIPTGDPTGDAIDRDFFLFAPGPYYATYLEDGVVVGSYEVSGLKKQVADLNDKVTTSDAAFVKSNAKGDQFATAQGYLADVCALIDGYKYSLAEKDAEILRMKASPTEVQGELLSLAASAGFEHRLKMDQTSEQLDAALKKISHYVPGAQGRLVKATPFVTTTEYSFLKKIVDHAAHPLSVLLQLESRMLARSKVVPALKATRVSPPLTRESTVTLVSSSLGCPLMMFLPLLLYLWNNLPQSRMKSGFMLWLIHWMLIWLMMLKNSEFAASAPSNVVVALSVQEEERGSPFLKMYPCLLQRMLEMLLLPLSGFSLVLYGFFVSFIHDKRGGRGMPEDTVCCSELGGTLTVATFLYPSTSVVGACFLYDAAVYWRFSSERKVLWTFCPAFCKA
ncbi:hypothetical protein Tco_0301072 [Tanacetum coccineum]